MNNILIEYFLGKDFTIKATQVIFWKREADLLNIDWYWKIFD